MHDLEIRGPRIGKCPAIAPVIDFLSGAEAIHQFVTENVQIALMADEGKFARPVAEERMQRVELLFEVGLFFG